ncbi:MAG: hypothetical protein LBQ79_05725 [Deltaproteobacteria bacterium]|nr:hypothetical protein [Deltaproteobacteria bacterium]
MSNDTVDTTDSMSMETMLALMKGAVKKAQAELHAAGLPYVVADMNGNGFLRVYPDGHTVLMPYFDRKLMQK